MFTDVKHSFFVMLRPVGVHFCIIHDVAELSHRLAVWFHSGVHMQKLSIPLGQTYSSSFAHYLNIYNWKLKMQFFFQQRMKSYFRDT